MVGIPNLGIDMELQDETLQAEAFNELYSALVIAADLNNKTEDCLIY